MFSVITLFTAVIQPCGGPIDVHLPDKEELWIEWVEHHEQKERDDGFRFEIQDENGKIEEVTIG